jgi:endonuclease YncB( thermonuclease family)
MRAARQLSVAAAVGLLIVGRSTAQQAPGVATPAADALGRSSPAQQSSSAYFPIAPNAVLETGDTWVQNGERFRLYGVQACLRGTTFTNKAGAKLDCGDASVAMFASFVKATNPQCVRVAKPGPDVAWVVCYADVGADRIDLATALLTQGFLFAALQPNGRPVHPPYFVAESTAKGAQRGLWQFEDLPNPSLKILEAQRAARPKP